jgi:hypothetical protein
MTGTLWTDYDFGRGKLDEIDLDLTAHAKLASISGGPFKGSVCGYLGFQDWKYPSGLEGSHDDYVLVPAITYNGPVTLNLTDMHFLDHDWTWNRNCATLDLSKSFELAKLGKSTFLLTPGIRTAYSDSPSKDTGFMYITPSLTLGWNWGAWSVNGFFKDQRNISRRVESLPYYGISISVSDLGKGAKQIGKLLRR